MENKQQTVMDYFEYNPANADKYFKIAGEKSSKCDLDKGQEVSLDLCINNIDEWKNVDRSKVTTKDVSGQGGSGTFLVKSNDENVDSNYSTLVLHLRKFDPSDEMSENRMHDVRKIFWQTGNSLPRLISGYNWYIEPFCEGPEVNEHVNDIDWPEILAKVHKDMPTEWYTKYREKKYETWPILKNAHDGSHVWEITCRSEWFGGFGKYQEFYINAQREPLSEAGKRLVNIHGDFHMGNVLLDKNKRVCIIDFEFSCVSWAIIEIGYIFGFKSFGTSSYEKKFEFCKRYLEALGLPSDEESVVLLIFDANCASYLRIFHPALIMKEINKCQTTQTEDFSVYQAFADFEDKARKDKELIKKIARNGFYETAKEEDPNIKETELKALNESYQKNVSTAVYSKRCFMSYQEENDMNKRAYENGVVRINFESKLNWEEINDLANLKAGGLLTRKEFEDSGLRDADEIEVWTFIKAEDGTRDVIQIGGFGAMPRYSSLAEIAPQFLFVLDGDLDSKAPYQYLYAKRDPVKNPEFAPVSERENEIYKKYVDNLALEFEKFKAIQLGLRRKKYSYDEEIEMLKNLFGKGITRIEVDRFTNYYEAKEMAEKVAMRLPTQEEFKEAELVESDDNFWTWCHREDKKPDMVQLGVSPGPVLEKYLSFNDVGKNLEFQWRKLDVSTNSDHFYAKIDPAKNTEFKMPRKDY